jgi:hypothetical protein
MIKVYLSHAIRGKSGPGCGIGEQNTNCDAARKMAIEIRAGLKHPIDLYVPAEHEEFVQIAYARKHINEEQILDTDCAIVKRCRCIVVLVPEGDELQGGRLIEHNFAIDNMINLCVFSKAQEAIDFIDEISAYDAGGGVALNLTDNDGE